MQITRVRLVVVLRKLISSCISIIMDMIREEKLFEVEVTGRGSAELPWSSLRDIGLDD